MAAGVFTTITIGVVRRMPEPKSGKARASESMNGSQKEEENLKFKDVKIMNVIFSHFT